MIGNPSKRIAIVEGRIENKNRIKSKYEVDFLAEEWKNETIA